MNCPRNDIILRFLSRELPPETLQDFERHLETCAVCRTSLEETQAAWAMLGTWEIDVSENDLTHRIQSALDADDAQAKRPVRWSRPIRVAASLIVAAGLGVGAGHLMPQDAPEATASAAPTLRGVSEAAALIGYAGESATGLRFSLETSTTSEGGEPQ